ncbi:hypothetical protein [Anatilimnocola floriformis]|uniref:hypothetical protein n=1 Tax=Anatilimnocola floriformis TaxID=2948575 RepID=UPI0020C535C9|nr:hypothetical protein [Anatilimnocola floriformis]
MTALACVIAFFVAAALAPRPQRCYLSAVAIVQDDIRDVRIYTVAIPGSQNEEKRAYYDFPPLGSLDQMLVMTSTGSRNHVSKARNFSGRAQQFTADDEADFLEISRFVERRLQGRPWVLRQPMSFMFEKKRGGDEKQSRVSDVFRGQP